MQSSDSGPKKSPKSVLDAAMESCKELFQSTPVMLHSIDQGGRIIDVNQRWLDRLGYEREEVLGRKSVEFLTEDSRARVLRDALPLFWTVGRAHSIGLQFMRKDGQVLDVLLDAHTVTDASGDFCNLAALYDPHDRKAWEEASLVVKGLVHIACFQHQLENLLDHSPDDYSTKGPEPTSFRTLSQGTSADEALGALIETAQDISVNLRVFVQQQAESLDTATEQRQELVMAARSIDGTLIELCDIMKMSQG